MNLKIKERFRQLCVWAGWTAFFSPAAFMLAFFISMFRDNYGNVMAMIGESALYAMPVVVIAGFLAGVIATIGDAIYSDKKMRVQGLVGVFSAFALIFFAFLAGITNAIIMGLAAFAQ